MQIKTPSDLFLNHTILFRLSSCVGHASYHILFKLTLSISAWSCGLWNIVHATYAGFQMVCSRKYLYIIILVELESLVLLLSSHCPMHLVTVE